LARIEQLLAILKKKLYPAGLLDYESKKYFVKQGGGDIDFQAAFKGMRDLDADLSAFGNLSAFERLLNNEKGIDFNAANLEQALLLEQLVKKGLKDDLESALGEIKSNKEKNISLFAYFQNTFRICLKNNISIEAYPNLIKYAEYLKSFSEIDLDKLLQEHQQAEDRLYRDLLKGSADARRIRAVDRFVKLLETAFKIQMSADEFRLFKANETDYTSLAMLAFLNKQLALEGRFENILGYHSALEEAKQHLNAFYESVQKRDDAFIANLDQSIKSEKQKIVILISGGYHTQNLKKLFRDKGYSYAVLAPKVTEATNQKKYEKLLLEPLMGKKSGPQGANPYRNRKSISALESDLLKGSKPKDGVRAMLAMAALALGDSQKSTVYSMARDAAILTGQEPDKFKGDVYKLAAARLASQESSASVTAGTTLRGVTSEWHLRNVRPAALDKEKEYLKLPLSLQPYRPRIHYSRRYSRHEILEELDGGDIDAQTLRLPQNRKGIAGPIRTVLLRSFYTTSVSNGEIYEDNLLVLNKDAKDPRTLGVVQLLDKKKEGIFETIYIKSFAREAIVQRALTLCLLYQGKIRRMVCTRCNAGAIDMCRRMTTDDRLSYDVVGTTYTFWKKGLEAGARLAKAPRPIEGHFSEPIRQMSEELARERGLVRRLRRKWEPAVVVFGSAR
ncbi:MAG: hypothetical protein WCG06_05035, partial [Candidatus Omnitrophota bacterium]